MRWLSRMICKLYGHKFLTMIDIASLKAEVCERCGIRRDTRQKDNNQYRASMFGRKR